MTAKVREVYIAKGLLLGADAYITKPFSNDELVASVKELLEAPMKKLDDKFREIEVLFMVL